MGKRRSLKPVSISREYCDVTGKVIYTKQGARSKAAQVRKGRRRRDETWHENFNTYKCETRPHWHIGHDPTRDPFSGKRALANGAHSPSPDQRREEWPTVNLVKGGMGDVSSMGAFVNRLWSAIEEAAGET